MRVRRCPATTVIVPEKQRDRGRMQPLTVVKVETHGRHTVFVVEAQWSRTR